MPDDVRDGKVAIRTWRGGDASYVAYLHARLYRDAYKFRDIFELYVLKSLTEFLENHEGCGFWVAEIDGVIVGSVAMVKTGPELAQLRWFIMDSAYQGMGIGRKLMRQAMDFVAASGYRRVFLWTIDILGAARHLYESFGFRIVSEKPNIEWTDGLITEELWQVDLENA
jgi:ribosomal protein S18 acetylase RimI-like enzyme